jgi:DNA-binding transcriptional regulator YhcF (GntR family)
MQENSPIYEQIQQDYKECLEILGELKEGRRGEKY